MPRVVGESGPVLLLLPGGAEAVEGFFPGLVEGLAEDPGCRVVDYDRPGTRTSTEEGSLSQATSALHSTLTDLGVGPVVVIGQSLGGAVALLLALDHPQDVAGLVLLDPTPVNDAALATSVGRTMRVTERLTRLPGGSRLVAAMLRSGARRSVRKHRMDPDRADAMLRMTGIDMAKLGRAVVGLEDLARDFDESRLPHVPAVVVTADRKPGSRLRRAHQRMADALGAPLRTWPGAEHSVHLTHPTEVLEVSRAVLREAAARP